ncbi:hypothetical protein I545_5793 [Mycobacterium kansasii 662]|uniref:Uncharacterized protein n=2 Tax=Mycobacterium kansasii TaxID=1768 RepID=X7YT67_MYCKA|nr:hypothetical protein I545_5793 [Mycobacterium kansasii 662]
MSGVPAGSHAGPAPRGRRVGDGKSSLASSAAIIYSKFAPPISQQAEGGDDMTYELLFTENEAALAFNSSAMFTCDNVAE